MKNKKKLLIPIVLIIAIVIIAIIFSQMNKKELLSVKSEKQLMKIYEGYNNYSSDGYFKFFAMPLYGILDLNVLSGRYDKAYIPFYGDASLDSTTESNTTTSSSTKEHSTTNLQVENVDEADITKTDGDYIYSISENKVIITNVQDPTNIKIEKEIYDSGAEYICGIDEAGRGPLAGPVVIAAAIMPKDSMIEGVNDSKKVSEKKREQLYEIITNEAIAYGVGIIDQKEIDRINILNATKEGLTMAVKELTTKPDIIIVDALSKIDTCGIPYKSIIKGDAKCYSIAAASIIAKVTRDRIMRQWDEIYPQYGFAKHKGYGTAAHIQAIKEYGLCPLHRLSFVKNIVNKD